MAVVINGTTGITSVNGSASTPSVTGTDTDTGIVYGTNTLSLATGGTTAVTVDSSQNVGIGTISPAAGGLTIYKTSVPYLKVQDATGFLNAGVDTSDSSIAFYNSFSGHKFLCNTGTVDAMRINSSGSVSIGTTAASGKLNLYNASNAYFEIASNSRTVGTTSMLYGQDVNGDGYVWNRENATVIFGTNNTTRMTLSSTALTIASGGRIDVNTAGEAYRINGSTNTAYIRSVASGVNQWFMGSGGSAGIQIYTYTANPIDFYTNGSQCGRFDTSGNFTLWNSSAYLYFSSASQFIRGGSGTQIIVGASSGGFYQQIGGSYYLVTTAGGSTSDASLKTNVQQLTGALEKVCAIRGVTFEFIEEPMCTADKGQQVGVIAQEVEAQFPEIVLTNEDGIKTVRYDRLVAPLIEAIKEQQAIIEQLRADVAQLKGQA